MSDVCTECDAKRGRISTKSIPGIGKSGNWRRAPRSSFLTRASSVALEAEEADWDSSLVALSVVEVVAEVVVVLWGGLGGRALDECSEVIVKRKKRKEKASEVRSVVRYAKR